MYYYIINPAAGNGRINKIQDKLKSLLKNLGIAGEFVKTTGGEDINKLLQIGIEQGYNTIVAVGGDGTVNDVANSIVKQDLKVAMGVIPMGRTNFLAKTFGIDNWESACQILSARKLETIDLGKISGASNKKDKYFLTSCEIGFESKVAKYRSETGILHKIRFGKLILNELLKTKNEKVTIEIDNNFTATTEMLTVIVSNCKTSNSPSKMFQPNPKDGLLDILIISKLPKHKMVNKISDIVNDNYEKLPQASIFKGSKIKIITKEAIPISVDGEEIFETPAEIEIEKKKLKVIVGKNRQF